MASIRSLLIHHTETLPPRPVSDVSVSTTGGLVGDSHDGGRAGRQVLLSDAEVLAALGLSPGDLREQITVDGLAVDSLQEGSLLRVGSAVAEVMGECKPCLTIGAYLGVDDPEAFRDQMTGRRGMFIRFLPDHAGAVLQVGDPVEVVTAAVDAQA